MLVLVLHAKREKEKWNRKWAQKEGIKTEYINIDSSLLLQCFLLSHYFPLSLSLSLSLSLFTTTTIGPSASATARAQRLLLQEKREVRASFCKSVSTVNGLHHHHQQHHQMPTNQWSLNYQHHYSPHLLLNFFNTVHCCFCNRFLSVLHSKIVKNVN